MSTPPGAGRRCDLIEVTFEVHAGADGVFAALNVL